MTRLKNIILFSPYFFKKGIIFRKNKKKKILILDDFYLNFNLGYSSEKINFDKLIKKEKRGLILCYIDSSNNKIHYRYFCPKLGFKEDFGTGSAHSSLYPFLKDRLDFSNKIYFSQESQRKSMGLISKLKEDNHIVIETDVSEYSVKALEID